jgi:dimeric dUTPase (all-alpha-NTP-PPase superfamily)
MVAGLSFLFSSGLTSEGNFEDGEETLLGDLNKTFLLWFIDINNFAFSDSDDLMESLYLSPHYFSNPKSLVHEFLSCLECDEVFAFSEKEGKCA